MGQQSLTAVVSSVLFVLLTAIIALTPIPFVTWSPGATVDVLGTRAGKPVINIDGASTFPTTGQLRMTTVSVTRVDSRLTLPEAVGSYFLPNRLVLPRIYVYQPGRTSQDIQGAERQQMAASQQAAVVAALNAANVPVTPSVKVERVSTGGPSNGKVQVGDQIVSANGVKVSSRAELQAVMDRARPGDIIALELMREGDQVTTRVTTVAAVDNPQSARLGIDTADAFDYQAKVNFDVGQEVVGPSGGLIFALAIYDELTPGSLVDGRIVAGTGEIKASGEVAAIGGARQKLEAARRAGASVFMLPAANCADIDTTNKNLTIVKVTKLSDAIISLELLKSPATAGQVPRC